MAHQEEPKSFLEKFITILIFIFVVLSIMLRPFVSGIRAIGAGPMGGITPDISYDQQRSIHFFLNTLLGFATVAFVLKNILKERLHCLRTRLDFPLLAFLGLGWLSLFWASHLYSSLIFIFTLFTLVLFFYVVVNLCAEGWGEKILSVALVVGVLLGVMAIGEYWVGYQQAQEKYAKMKKDYKLEKTHIREKLEGRLKAREAMGPFLTSNILGGFLALLIPALLGFGMELWDRKERPWLRLGAVGLALLSVALGLFYTNSKGAWMAMAVGLIVFVLLLFRQKLFSSWKRILLTTVALAVLVFAGWGGIQLTGKVSSWEHSTNIRLGYWEATWNMIKDHPFFGCGINNFENYYPAYKLAEAEEMVDFAHNDYLQIFAELGFFGIFLYLWIWIAFFRRVGKDLSVSAPSSWVAKRKTKKKKKSQRMDHLKDEDFLSRERKRSLILIVSGLAGLLLIDTFQLANANVVEGIDLTLPTMIVLWIFFAFAFTFPTAKDIPTKIQYNTSPAPYYYLRLGLMAAISVFLFHSLGSFVFYSTGVFFLVLLFMAFLLGDHHNLVREKKKEKYLINLSLTLPSQLVLFFAFFFYIGFSLLFLQSNMIADRHIRKGDEMRQKIFKAEKDEVPKWLKKAQEHYMKAFQINPLDEKTAMGVAKVTELLHHYKPSDENFKTAVKYYKRADYLAPRDYRISYQLARLYQKHPKKDPRFVKTEDYLQKAVRSFPTNPQFRYALGRLYLTKAVKLGIKDYWEKARKELQMAKAYNQRAPKLYSIRGQVIEKALIELAKRQRQEEEERKKRSMPRHRR